MRRNVRRRSGPSLARCNTSLPEDRKPSAQPWKESEDDAEQGRHDIARRKPAKNDVVVGIAASGRTPYTIAAIREAGRRGARTIAVTCNPHSELERAAHLAIVTEVGPEIVAGSSRLKAGTAQKMVLNMLSTGALTRLGYVYGNLMVHLHLNNEKLVERGIAMVESSAKVDRKTAKAVLKATRNDVSIALVMLKAKTSRARCPRALRAAQGNLRKAIALATGKSS